MEEVVRHRLWHINRLPLLLLALFWSGGGQAQETDSTKIPWTVRVPSNLARFDVSSDSVGSLQPCDIWFQRIQAATEYIRESSEVKKLLVRWILNTTAVQLSVSQTIVFIGAEFFARSIVERNLGRATVRGRQPDDSLFFAEITKEDERRQNCRPYSIPALSALSSPNEPDLLIYFDIHGDNTLIASVDPYRGKTSFEEGVDFLFYFDALQQKEVYSQHWMN